VSGATSVNDLAFLSDSQSAAIVDRDGAIRWWSVPRFDSPAVFGSLLDADAGHWGIRPAGAVRCTRRYLDDTLALESVFETDAGAVRLTDVLALEPGSRSHEIGLVVPRAIVRVLEGMRGEVPVDVELAPRFEYGLTLPHLRRVEGGVQAVAGADELRLRTPVELDVVDGHARGRVTMREGDRVGFVLQYDRASGPPMRDLPPAETLLEETIAGWRSWVGDHDAYQGCFADLVHRSAIVLQGLTYQPSGGVIAAATTSLPEIVGGTANWDYRFVWLRDLALTMRALWVAACPNEAERHLELIWRALGAETDRPVQIMVGLDGERDLSERELEHLTGFAGSSPVRVGNEAWRQRQLDVLGEVVDAAYLMREQLGSFSAEITELVRNFADRAARDWREPDAGMWEARDRERHYTSSKAMRWVALDRAIKLADRLGGDVPLDRWRRAAAELHEDVLREAWHPEVGAFTGAYGSKELDASVLLLPMVGFIDAHDERMRSTVKVIRRELTEGPHVHRWADDPNGFIICGFWLAQNLALQGDLEAAERQITQLAALANDVGLLAEMADPATGELIGNTPQAFSHVGLVNSAWLYTQLADHGGRDTDEVPAPGS